MNITAPTMIRRLAGMIYDFCVAGTLALFISYIGMFFVGSIEADSLVAYAFSVLQLLVGLLYFIYFCTQRNNTAGMWVWKLRMISSVTEGKPSALQIMLRYISLLSIITIGFLFAHKLLDMSVFASFGIALLTLSISFLWSLKDSKQRLLHEALSNTQLVDTRFSEIKS
ncbi:MAG: RDD family protein [Thiotrichaceae bacterium]|nr:RDD family protein [Thiotrichaceae bacterium]